MINLLLKYKQAWIDGAIVTFKLVTIVWIAGITTGIILAFALSYLFKNFSKTFSLLSFFLSSIPVLVILYWFHYPFQYMLQITIDPFYTALGVLLFINIFIVIGIIIESQESVLKQFYEAALVHGVKKLHYIFYIQLPLVIRQSISNIIAAQVSILHMSLFAGLISVDEMFRTALRINAIEYKPVEIFTILALFFIIISLPLLGLSKFFKIKFGRDLSEK